VQKLQIPSPFCQMLLGYIRIPPITVFGTRDAAFEVCSRENGTPFPALSEQIELDSDDLCPEGGVTKQLWKNHYEGIEQWREEFAKGVLPFGSRQSFINKIVSIISVKISYGI